MVIPAAFLNTSRFTPFFAKLQRLSVQTLPEATDAALNATCIFRLKFPGDS